MQGMDKMRTILMEKIHREKNYKYLVGITKKNKYTVAKQQKKKSIKGSKFILWKYMRNT